MGSKDSGWMLDWIALATLDSQYKAACSDPAQYLGKCFAAHFAKHIKLGHVRTTQEERGGKESLCLSFATPVS